MASRADVITEARTWLGTRWLHQACVKGVGVDCIGLVGGVALALKLPGATAWAGDMALHSYGRTPDPRVLLGACAKYLDRVKERELGGILVMKFANEPQHFALLSGPDYIIHAYAQARRVVEHRLDALWASRILAVYRFRGLDD